MGATPHDTHTFWSLPVDSSIIGYNQLRESNISLKYRVNVKIGKMPTSFFINEVSPQVLDKKLTFKETVKICKCFAKMTSAFVNKIAKASQICFLPRAILNICNG